MCRNYDIRVAFFTTRLTKVKDVIPVGMNSKVVYKIPCSCGRIYIGETIRQLELRVKEHVEACILM